MLTLGNASLWEESVGRLQAATVFFALAPRLSAVELAPGAPIEAQKERLHGPRRTDRLTDEGGGRSTHGGRV